MNKLLTIAIPVYNTEAYIKRCLDSLLIDSNFELLDILVISDGSPDKSVDIIKKYTAKYPGVFRLIEKENGGHGSVINRGIKEAKGKYFRVLDSDDWFDKDVFNIFINHLKKIQASLVITNSIIEYVYKNVQLKEDYHKILNYGKIETVSNYDFKAIEGKDVVSLANATFDTKILQDSGEELFEKCYYEDLQYDLFFLKNVNSFIALDLYVYHYFIGRPEQSVSPQSALNHYDDRLRITLSLVDKISDLLSSDSNVNGKAWLENTYLRHIYIHYKFFLNMGLCEAVHRTKEFNRMIEVKSPEVKAALNKKYKYVQFANYIPGIVVWGAKMFKSISHRVL